MSSLTKHFTSDRKIYHWHLGFDLIAVHFALYTDNLTLSQYDNSRQEEKLCSESSVVLHMKQKTENWSNADSGGHT